VTRLAVLGGGCAGLSLALELAERGLARGGLTVVEPRTAFRRDRTWGHWDLEPHRFADLVAHRWSRWKLRREGRVHVHGSRRYRYCELPADRFYQRALERLAEHPDVDLQLGVRAGALRETQGVVRVDTSRGELCAEHVFDARPGRPGARAPELLQHFLGVRVRTEQPCFDPHVVTLMDFDVPQDLGIHFFYVLPADPCTALVEATFLSPRPFDAETYRAAIDRYLEVRHGVRKAEVLEEERGVIPMSAARPRTRISPRVLRLGTGGGLVRPSTGYAFLAMQRFARRLADRLQQGRPGPPPVRDRALRAMDAVFLHHLRSHPAQAPELFERLFARVEPETLVRFLGDEPGLRDRVAVVRAMPFLPFVRSAWRSRAAWSAA